MNYETFIAGKLARIPPTGIDGYECAMSGLFPHQQSLVTWAVRRGRCAIFADTGLGKSRMQIAWADAVQRHIGLPVLILAPLAVAAQTAGEGKAMCIPIKVCRDQSEIGDARIVITNYERLHRFDPSVFGAVVLDESSCIKHSDSKTLKRLIEAFSQTPFRLCATATPAPNDWTELGTHAEFLGICTQQEMLAEYFAHDGGDTSKWRLKGHARELFWRWVCTWGAMIRKPSDLGFDDSAYNLPSLHTHEHVLTLTQAQAQAQGTLMALEASTLSERRSAKRGSLSDRVAACAELVNADAEQWLVWCELNDEADALCEAIPDAVEIRGTDDPDDKERKLLEFIAGKSRVLVTKPSIAGFGINAQRCARMAFVGATDSFESYYQSVRRCWRFGQKRDVHVHIFLGELEGAILRNLKRKESEALAMAESLSAETHDAVMAEVFGSTRSVNTYNAAHRVRVPSFLEAA
jgi:superfamily II DNA or RNA helicase